MPRARSGSPRARSRSLHFWARSTIGCPSRKPYWGKYQELYEQYWGYEGGVVEDVGRDGDAEVAGVDVTRAQGADDAVAHAQSARSEEGEQRSRCGDG